jgi:hypothetical protein
VSTTARVRCVPLLLVTSAMLCAGGDSMSAAGALVNAVTDCHLKGDGVSDDLAAFNACRDTHPGATIVFPKTQAPGKADYFFSDSLVPSGAGMTLEGANGPGWGSGVKLKFAAHKTGIRLLQSRCTHCSIRNLVLEGSEPYTTANPEQNTLPCNPGSNVKYKAGVICVETGDGILVNANFSSLEHLYITGFGRHGVNADSAAETEHWADNLMGVDITANGNRGNGFYFRGGDTNAGSLTQAHAYVNQLYGFVLNDFLGNAFYSPEAHTNHQHGRKRGDLGAITEISGKEGVATVAYTGKAIHVGNSITVSGAGGFDGTYFVSEVPDEGHIRFLKTGNLGAVRGGKIEFASNDEHFTAAGVSGGGYYSDAINVNRVLVMPYCESDQDAAVLPAGIIIVGGDMGCGVDQATVLDAQTLRNVQFIKQNASDYGNQGLVLQAGRTKDVDIDLQYRKYNDTGLPGNTYFMQWSSPPGAYDRFALVDGSWAEAGIPRLLIQGLGGSSKDRSKNGDTTLSARGTGKIVFNGSPGFYPNEGTGTGGVHFQSGGKTPVDVAVIDDTGRATFKGGVTTTRVATGFVEVPFSPTLSLDAGQGDTFKVTLSGDVRETRLINATGGQQVNIVVCQDGSGNHGFTWPTNVKGGAAVSNTPLGCTGQSFVWDGKVAYGLTNGAQSK